MFSEGPVFVRDDFFQLLDLEIKRARRYQNLFGLLRFELFNTGKDTGGRNKSLRPLLRLVREEIRETDLVGQTKKNEIMVLLPYCDSIGSEIVCGRLTNLVKDFHFGNDELKVLSGYVCFPMEGTDMGEILNRLTHKTQESVAD
ncbi:MAG: diguanylate cyclase [Deltaproteobacteria bacterium]|nr:diguanylate cyclase [Deltaproteobacteria bacterium]